VILGLTKIEYAVMESLISDGMDDSEALSVMVNSFGIETRLVNDKRLKAKMITGGIAS